MSDPDLAPELRSNNSTYSGNALAYPWKHPDHRPASVVEFLLDKAIG